MNCQLIIRNLYTFFIKSQLDLLKYTPSCRPILIRLDPRPKSDHDSAVSKRIYKYSFLLILNDRRIVTQFFFYDLFRFAKIRFVRNADFQIQFPLRSCGYICKTVICQYTVRNNYRLVVDRRQLCIKDLYLFYSSFDIFLCHDNIIAYGKRF